MATRLRISGRVQGVGYRASFARQAQRLGLSGWVRNRLDGSVEAVVAGDAEAMRSMLEWSRRGPPSARVDEVVTGIAEEAVGNGFEILPTA